MIAYIALLVLTIAILVFRGYRLIHFYKESKNSPEEDERKLARKNFIIHLVFSLFILVIVVVLFYNLFRP
jgi:Na+/H+ antiporter NhaC